MMERRDYDALAQDINLDEITSCVHNAILLRMLRDGDPNLSKQLYIVNEDSDDVMNDFVVREGDDFGWLGYFIGRSEVLEELYILNLPEGGDRTNSFFDGMSQNRSLKNLYICDDIGVDGWSRLGSFIENNHNLSHLEFEGIMIGHEGVQNLASALDRTNHHSLKGLAMNGIEIGGEGLAEIATALRLHTQLEKLQLDDNSIGRDGCITIGNTLNSWSASNKLRTLRLSENLIDDEGLQALVSGLMNCHSLKHLDLGGNRSITTNGLRSLFPLLQSEAHSLETLLLYGINIGDDGALTLVEGLRGNKFLEELQFNPGSAGITAVGWSAFSRLLCDTSTINNTYMSNHTLTTMGWYDNEDTPEDIQSFLTMNTYQQAAIWKILQSHPDLDMEPFFKSKMKFLPSVMSWFERVERNDMGTIHESKRSFQSRKLSALYKFVRAMPVLAVTGYWEGRVIYIEAKKRMLDDEEAVAWERLGGRPIDEASKRKRMRHE